MSDFPICTKITVKDLCGTLTAPEDTKPVWLCEIFGIVRDTFNIPNKADPTKVSNGFTGDFRGIDIKTGKTARSGKLYVPAVVESLLLPALKEEGTNGVEFAFRVGIQKGKSPTGYVFCAEPLLPMAENDPVEAMKSKFKSLAAPVLDKPALAAAK